jgi:hypothetical protein
MDSDDDAAGSADSFDDDNGRGGESAARGKEVSDHLTELSELLSNKAKAASTRVNRAIVVFEMIKRVVGDPRPA